MTSSLPLMVSEILIGRRQTRTSYRSSASLLFSKNQVPWKLQTPILPMKKAKSSYRFDLPCLG